MNTQDLLLALGIILLAAASLLGFMQARIPAEDPAQARWRVVHVGGTAGAVQLIALSSVWHKLSANDTSILAPVIAVGIAFSTWAFFIGPLMRALGDRRWYRRVHLAGALFAVPGYLALPFSLLRL